MSVSTTWQDWSCRVRVTLATGDGADLAAATRIVREPDGRGRARGQPVRDDSDLTRVNAAAGTLVPVERADPAPGRRGARSGAANRRGGRPDGRRASARRGLRRRHRAGACAAAVERPTAPQRRCRLVRGHGRPRTRPDRRAGRAAARPRRDRQGLDRRRGGPASPRAARPRCPGRDRRRPRVAGATARPWRVDVSEVAGGPAYRVGLTHGGLATSSVLGRDVGPRTAAPSTTSSTRPPGGPLEGRCAQRRSGRHRAGGQHLVAPPRWSGATPPRYASTRRASPPGWSTATAPSPRGRLAAATRRRRHDALVPGPRRRLRRPARGHSLGHPRRARPPAPARATRSAATGGSCASWPTGLPPW